MATDDRRTVDAEPRERGLRAAHEEPARSLKPQLGLLDTTAIALGAMIGAGVYVSLGEAAKTTGASVLLAVLIGAAVATFNGLSAAELGANDPRAGGAYQFGRQLVSPLVGFLAGWLFLLASLAAGTTFALTFAAYLAPLLPGVPPRVTGVTLVVAVGLLNVLGVKPAARATRALVGINLLVLAVFLLLTAPRFQVERFQPVFTGGLRGLLQAGALLFFAFTGYARPVTVAEEVKEPRRTLPRAIASALGLVTLLYLAVTAATLGVLGAAEMGKESAPLRTAVSGTFGPILLSMGALVASATVLLTEIWGLSRLVFAMARNRDLPGWLGQLSDRDRIPRRAVLAVVGVMLLLAGCLDLRPALEASSMSLLVYYAVMNLSALRLPQALRLYPAAVPACGLTACLLLALSLPWKTLAGVTTVAAVGWVYYTFRRPDQRAEREAY
jgi:basic amino acid/polyamine antiporter, APA family